MLTVISGNLGTGKTLFLTIVGYFAKTKIISNFKLNYPNNKIVDEFDIKKFVNCEYEDCIIFLDEAYAYLESRLSNSNLNLIMSYILFQSRKKSVNLYLTCQLTSTIDLRFRQLTQCYICAELTEFSYQYTIITKSNNLQIKFDKEKVKSFYQFYNTNEVILPMKGKINALIVDSTSRYEEVVRISHLILNENPEKTKISKKFISLYLLKNDLPSFLESNIHSYITEYLKNNEIEVENN